MRAASPQPVYPHRRSSSVPLPNNYHPITIPTIPFLSMSRPTSPVGNISRSTRMMIGQRRASSARPAGPLRSWTMPTLSSLPRDNSPLPEVDTSLFEQPFLSSTFSFPSAQDGTPFVGFFSQFQFLLFSSLPYRTSMIYSRVYPLMPTPRTNSHWVPWTPSAHTTSISATTRSRPRLVCQIWTPLPGSQIVSLSRTPRQPTLDHPPNRITPSRSLLLSPSAQTR
jgi:transcription factor SOX7/8/10/18 (SOX group E/F)